MNLTVSQRQTESGRTLTIRINNNRTIALERSVINYLGFVVVVKVVVANCVEVE